MNGRDASRQFLDTLHGACRDLDHLGLGLRGLSEALYMLGNERLAEKIETYAEHIENIGKRLTDAYSEKLNADVDESVASVGLTLKAILNADPEDLRRRFGCPSDER